ncbi:MAG TPA: hypothetical protein DEG43_02975 [Acidimicrobiaceae bacterium]|nr:hypothetical protein [Acidimicrobiaceae bacterium]
MSALATAEIESLVRSHRRQLYALFETLSPEQWLTQSLCGEWRVRDLAAHLVIATEASTARVAKLMARHRCGFDEAMTHGVAQMADLSTVAVCELLRSHQARVVAPPVIGVRSPLMDIVVHTFDACIPLGLPFEIDPTAYPDSLNFLNSSLMRRQFKCRIPNSQVLVATDVEWNSRTGSSEASSHGSSGGVGRAQPALEATAAQLLMALSGRDPVVLGQPSPLSKFFV